MARRLLRPVSAGEASRERIEELAADWKQAWVECRSYGHNWVAATVTHRRGSYTIIQRCARRCGATRAQDITEDGYPTTGWAITYPPGYLLPKDTGRVGPDGRAALRLVSITSQHVTEEPT